MLEKPILAIILIALAMPQIVDWMKSLSLSMLVMLAVFKLSAQTKYALVNNMWFENRSNVQDFVYQDANGNGVPYSIITTSLGMSMINPALRIEGQKFGVSEFGISRLNWSRESYSSNLGTIDSLRPFLQGNVKRNLSVGAYALKSTRPRRRYVPSLFVQMGLGFTSIASIPSVSDLFPNHLRTLSANLLTGFRYEFSLSQKVFLNAGCQLNLLQVSYARLRTDAPQLPIRSRVSTYTSLSSLNQLPSLRLGIGVNL